MNIVVILPTYNERDNILLLLERLHSELRQLTGYHVRYLVVDDNSPDQTAELVKDYMKKKKDIYLITGKKEGLGKALLRGMEYAIRKLQADIIVQMDADLSHDPVVIKAFINNLENGADMVVGSRYINGGSIPVNWGLHRKLYSVAGNSIVRYGLGLTGIHDWTGGFRAYKRFVAEKLINKMSLYNGYLFQIVFLHRALLMKINVVEVPIHFTDRKYGKSKIIFSEYIYKILEYITKVRTESLLKGPFKKFAVVGTIGFIINTVFLELLVLVGLHPSLSSAIGAEIAIISNFILNNSWTFKSRKISGDKQLRKFIQFNLTSLGAVIIQAGTVWAGTQISGAGSYRLWYIAGVGMGLIWNYIMYSRVIWKVKNS